MEFPDKEMFRAWLQKQPAKEVIAADWGFCDCPLARWLNETGVAARAHVQPTTERGILAFWRTSPFGEERPLPEWAITFGNTVDLVNSEAAVTSEDCLAILDE